MPFTPPAATWTPLIRAAAAKYNVDPRAALAVAGMEGMSGRVGDGGHAFGPFQLNDAGGTITNRPGDHRAFAESPAGIDWAMQQIAKVAGGMHGQAAVSNIVRRFERPAAPDAEVSGALARYGGLPPGVAPMPGTPGAAPGVRPGIAPNLAAIIDSNNQMQGLNVPSLASMMPSQAAQTPLTGSVTQPGEAPPVSPVAGKVAQVAKTMLGTPYVWGGNTPGKALDCSSFVQQTMAKMGVKIPRTTYDQVKHGAAVQLNQLAPGDAVFTEPGHAGPNHVGLYVGNGMIQESPHTGDVNKLISLKDFLGGGFVAARRYLNA
jgi:cell wall-associated NlpC family hydrolase